MITKYIRAKENTYQINIPKEYMNCTLEINIRKINDIEKRSHEIDPIKLIQRTAGLIQNKEMDPIDWQRQIRNEWERQL